MLMRQQDLMDVVRVRRTAGDVVARHLEHVAQARGIVDIDVGAAALAALEEGELQVAEGVVGLEAARG